MPPKDNIDRNANVSPPETMRDFYEEPGKVDGFKNFNRVVAGRGPDPLKAGNAFRTFTGDPIATELIAARQAGTLPEFVVDKPNFLPSVFLRLGHTRSLAVCRIEVARGIDFLGRNNPGGWHGTGFLVGSKLLLTNHHVMNSIAVARETRCQFNYLTGPDGRAEAHIEYRVLPDELFLTSPYQTGLDYTFVAVEPAAAAQFGTVDLERAAYVVHPGDFANIIQHPQGRYQEVVLHENEVLNDTGTVLHYVSDTDYGSSGSPVFDNNWRLIALHHARQPNHKGLQVSSGMPPKYLNEGIKISTIATDLEQRAESEAAAGPATTVLAAFKGINSISGFFGTLGRSSSDDDRKGAEVVVDLYKGTEADIDVGFWNIEWFSNRYSEKVKDVATLVADFNLDIWALSESSPKGAEELVKLLKHEFGLEFDVAHSEPDAGIGKQSTSVLWNTATIAGGRIDWPDQINSWFGIDSRDFDDLRLTEAVHGKVFNRYPGLFQFTTADTELPLDFYLVPLHLKARAEGSLRRGMATKILAAAVNSMIEDGHDADWVIGGDFNAEVSSGDFAPLADRDFIPVSAEDEDNGSITYVKGRYKSLIDHVYLSPNMARRYGPRDFYIVAADRQVPDYVRRISDHRPVMMRLSLGAGEAISRGEFGATLPDGLADAILNMYGKSTAGHRRASSVGLEKLRGVAEMANEVTKKSGSRQRRTSGSRRKK